MKDRIIAILQKEGKPLIRRDLVRRLSLPRKKEGVLKKILKDLEKEGQILTTHNNHYTLPEKFNLISGTIQGHRKGFSFLIPDNQGEEDLYISIENRGSAMHGDRVLARRLPPYKKREGEVSQILERRNHHIVGTLEMGMKGLFAYLIPDDSRISHHIFIPKEGIKGALHRQKVVVSIQRWPEKSRGPEGQVIEILGFEGEVGVDIEGVIRELNLPQEFPSQVLKEAELLVKPIPEEEISSRLDLRDETIFTVDGDDAKDFDDAISLTPKGDGLFELGVHIADVSYYVKPGDAVDVEAQKRGTSIYLLDRVIPMLPQALSNNICSLMEGEDRLTYSLFMTLKGEDLVNYRLNRSIIRVKKRFTYGEVNSILKGESAISNDWESILFTMRSISEGLRKKRLKNGSLDFNFPEVKIILDEEGNPQEIQKVISGPGESIIEEFMLLANQAVADYILQKEVPSLYRIHEQPSKEKIQELNEFLTTFGYGIRVKKGEVHARAFQDLLFRCKGTEAERPIQNMVLRSLPQARYAALNVGHFGLAIDLYTHFTSPIRRYPDLVIHRILSLITEGKIHGDYKKQLEDLLFEVADLASRRERLAMEAEWEVEDIKKVQYMEQKKGEVFPGIISGVINSGFFVELENTVEGFVRVSNLVDDYYFFNQKQMTLTGERKKKVFRLGDGVLVQVEGVNKEQKEIDFRLVKKFESKT